MIRLYVEPAKKRAKALRRRQDGVPPGPEPEPVETDRVPTRAEFVAAGVTMFGQTPEHWAKEYDTLVGAG